MDTITQFFSNIWNGFSELPPARRISLLATGLVTIAIILGLVVWANQSEYRVLFSNLASDDAANIVAKLKEKKIPYKISDSGDSVSVPSDRVTEVRLDLASGGLPQGTGVGFEIFDRKTLGATEFEQQLNFRRALQGELARTINSLDEIQQARVHLALPKDSLFVEEQKKPTASVTLKLKSGRVIRPDQIDGITHLVASSVEGLNPADVIVVDSKGNILSRKKDDSGFGQLTASQVEYRNNFERSMVSQIQTMLEKVVGPGKAVVRVSADLDFKVMEQTEELYDPDSPVIRSTQRQTENITPLPNATAGRGTESKSDEVINYEINRTINKTVMPVGEIRKLSIAVLVDGKYTTDDKGEEVYQARDKAELDKLVDLVRKSVGFSAARGDQVVVTDMPFRPSAEDELALPLTWTQQVSEFTPYLKYIIILVVILFLFLFVLKPMIGLISDIGRKQQQQPEPPGTLPEAGEEGRPIADHVSEESKVLTDIDLIRQMAAKDAKRFAELLRNWIQ
ncbi:MAG: flagellar M-ring protein FliF [Syntrophobacterales bacterium]|jgi:flagellar M-ring protein FliF|nr:flagellar M-ring protein FliF [Syntrophobacterales bacterium]